MPEGIDTISSRAKVTSVWVHLVAEHVFETHLTYKVVILSRPIRVKHSSTRANESFDNPQLSKSLRAKIKREGWRRELKRGPKST